MIDCMDLPRGVGNYQNYSVESNCMGYRVESDRKDKSDVNVFK